MKRPSILMPVVAWLDVRVGCASHSGFQLTELPIEFYQNLFAQFNARITQLTETLEQNGHSHTRNYVDPVAVYDLFGVIAQEELDFIAQACEDECVLKKRLFRLMNLLERLANYLDDATQEMTEETGVLAQIAQCFQMRYNPELYGVADQELLAERGFQNAALSILPGLAMRIREFCLIFVREVRKHYDLSAELRLSDDSLQGADLSSLSRYFDARLQEIVADSFPKSRSLTPRSTPPLPLVEGRIMWGRSCSDSILDCKKVHHAVKKNSKSSLSTCISASGLKPMTPKLGFWQKWHALSTRKKWLFGALVLTEAIAIAVLAVFVPGSTLFALPAVSWMTMNILAVISTGVVVVCIDTYLISKSLPAHKHVIGEEAQLLDGIKLKKSKTRQHYRLLAEQIPQDWHDLSSGSDDSGSESDESLLESTPVTPF